MGEWFGLGIMIQVRDFASTGLAQVRDSFNNTRRVIDDFSTQSSARLEELSANAEQHFQSLTLAGLGMQQAGGQFLSFSNTMLAPLKSIGSEVVKTSAQFENWQKTLKALYKDEQIANEKLAWGMQLAAETPFEVSDVTQALIAFKAIGAEADQMLTSTSGIKQTLLEFVGDLASLRPDVGLDGVMMGVRNLIGGDGGKSLTMRLDMDLETILGRSWGDTTEQLVQDLADVSGKIANGLMNELEGTWDQVISNLEDQFVRFQKALGDAGVFDAVKKSLMSFANVISAIDDAKMEKIGKNLKEAFTMIWKPIDLVIQALSRFASVIIDMVATSPLLGKIVVGFLAITGAVTGLTGFILTFGGSLITTISSLGLFLIALRNTEAPMLTFKNALRNLGTSATGVISKMSALAGALAIGFAVWKFDIGGFRTMATNLVNTVLYAFQESAKISRMGSNDMIKAVSQLDMTKFGDRLIYRLLQLRVLWQAVCEAWNDYTLSDETFKKVQALGLLPLLNAILDFKMKFEAFWKGFKEGFKDISDTIAYVFKKVGDAVMYIYNVMFPIKDTVKKTKDSMSGEGLNLAPWTAFGYVVGGIAGILTAGMIGKKVFDIVKSIGSLGLAILKLPFKTFTIIAKSIELVGKGIGLLTSGFTKAFPFVASFLKGLMSFAMAHPVIAVIALVLMALVPIFVKLWKESESFREGIIELGTAIISAMAFVGLAIAEVVGAIVLAVTSIVLVIAQILATIVVVIGSIIAVVVTMIGSVVAVITGIIATGVAVVVSIITLIVATVQTVGAIIQGIFQTAFAIVQGIVQTFLAIVHALMTGDFTSLGEKLKSIWQGVGTRIGEIWQGVASRVKEIWQGVQDFLSTLWNGIQTLWNTICNGIKTSGTNVVSGIKSAWSGVTGFFSGIWSGIKSGAKTMFDWISEKFTWLSNKITSAKNAMSKIGDGISSVFGGKKDGSHANGLSYVPYDGYVAELHKGEMVLTAQESKKYRQQGRGVLDNLLSEVPLETDKPKNRKITPKEPKDSVSQPKAITDLIMPQIDMRTYVTQPQEEKALPQANILGNLPIMLSSMLASTKDNKQDVVPTVKVEDNSLLQQNILSGVQNMIEGIQLSPQKDTVVIQQTQSKALPTQDTNLVQDIQSVLGNTLTSAKQENPVVMLKMEKQQVPTPNYDNLTNILGTIVTNSKSEENNITPQENNIQIPTFSFDNLKKVLDTVFPINNTVESNVTVNPMDSNQNTLLVLQDMKNLMSILVAMKDKNNTQETYIQPIDNTPTMKVLTSLGAILSNLAVPKEEIKQTLESPTVNPYINVDNTLTPNFNVTPIVKGVENPIYNQLVTNNHNMAQTFNNNNPIENHMVQTLNTYNPMERVEDVKTERPIMIAPPQQEGDNVSPIVLQDTRGVNPMLAQTPSNTQNEAPQNIDNSVTFSEGSIQINVQNGQDLDIDKIAKQLMAKIQREQQLRNTLRYRNA